MTGTVAERGRIGRPPKYDWLGVVLPAAAAFVESFDTGVTLRQTFYFLASRGFIENTRLDYASLSDWTTRARDGELDGIDFPDFEEVGRGRGVTVPMSFASPDQAQERLRGQYRRDRQEHADRLILLAVEKAGLVNQLFAAFGGLGLPVISLGGFASQTLRTQVRRWIERDGRPAVLVYAGDFDPAGVVIDRSFVERVGVFDDVVRVGLNIDQLAGLPVSPFPVEKAGHSLIPGFEAEYGDRLEAMDLPRLVQFELDALAPDVLLELYRGAIDAFFDKSAYERSLAEEADDHRELLRRWS